MENAAQCEKGQGSFSGYVLLVASSMFLFSIKLYIGFLVSARAIKKEIFQSQVQTEDELSLA